MRDSFSRVKFFCLTLQIEKCNVKEKNRKMRKLIFYSEAPRGFYCEVLFDPEEGRMVRTKNLTNSLDFNFYGLQKTIKICNGNKADCFRKIQKELKSQSIQLEIDDLLICIDESGWWEDMPINGSIAATYQFMVRK